MFDTVSDVTFQVISYTERPFRFTSCGLDQRHIFYRVRFLLWDPVESTGTDGGSEADCGWQLCIVNDSNSSSWQEFVQHNDVPIYVVWCHKELTKKSLIMSMTTIIRLRVSDSETTIGKWIGNSCVALTVVLCAVTTPRRSLGRSVVAVQQ